MSGLDKVFTAATLLVFMIVLGLKGKDHSFTLPWYNIDTKRAFYSFDFNISKDIA